MLQVRVLLDALNLKGDNVNLLFLVGLAGGLCFALAGIPGAISCIWNGRNPGIPSTTAWLVFLGTIITYTYLAFNYFVSNGVDWVLSFNYLVEFLAWGTVLFYTYLPKKQIVK